MNEMKNRQTALKTLETSRHSNVFNSSISFSLQCYFLLTVAFALLIFPMVKLWAEDLTF